MEAKLDQHNVIAANDQFWEQMLAMKLETIPRNGDFSVGSNHLRGSVEIKGAWEGCIEVRMDPNLALEATAAMMMQPLDTVAKADVVDAIKEIANMIGGILKSSLPRPTTMNVPEFAAEVEGASSACDAGSDCVAVTFRHQSGIMMIRVSELELTV